jgi:hypothetical protein
MHVYVTMYVKLLNYRIKDPSSTRTMHLGIGFRERDTAFDFKNALNEFVRYIDRMSTAEEMHKKVQSFGFVNRVELCCVMLLFGL